jgi:peptidyl-prolyl cis-trans isomerase SurA
MTSKIILSSFTCLGLLAVASGARAQDLLQGVPPLPGSELAGPAPASSLAPQPDVQRIVAVVNDIIISAYDLNLRMALVVAATGGVSSEQQYLQLRTQVLQGMVDELLEIQEATRLKVDITDHDVDDSINTLAKNNNMTLEQFTRYLSSIGSDISTLRPQIKSSLAWQQLIRGRYGSQAQVSDAEVTAVIDRLKASAGQPEYHVAEIFLTNESPNRDGSAEGLATQISQQLQGSASFDSMARQFSRSTTAALGGDIGWVQASQVSPPIATALARLQIGQVSPPIAADGGYYIVQLKDRRRILAADPMDAQLGLKQISLDISPDATAAETTALVNRAAQATAGQDACNNTAGVASALGTSNFGDLGTVAVRDLPADLRDAVKDVAAGQAAQPVVRGNQLQILVVCTRTEPQVQPPNPNVIENNLTNQRLSMMARRYLRDLRQDAIIDYR